MAHRAMDRQALERLLGEVRDGRVTIDTALSRLRQLPYDDLGFAKVDHHRSLRGGAPEAVFCPGKTPEQVVEILRRLADHHTNVLATRAEAAVANAVAAAGLPHVYHERARIIIVRPERTAGVGLVVVVAAGTADLPVAEEAALVAECLGDRVERVWDCGVAGLHRLLDHMSLLSEANVIVVVAGMEGALPSVVGGLVDRPVIAVPTSVGYGASFGGIAALLAMLNSCAPGVSVVNIDNGYGAAHQASLINRLIAKIR
jgi:pyridinium-3,5-biscarboxylic acid mononucleotide synthase